jgi:hypothetical protein
MTTSMVGNIAIAIVIGYVFGSFPAAYLVARLRKRIDIRDVGSRNMGAMNVFYQVGPAEAALVTLADLGKGIGAILLMRYVLGKDLISPFDLLTGLTATAAILGHILPVFLRFRGGKGAATAIGILIFLMPTAYYLSSSHLSPDSCTSTFTTHLCPWCSTPQAWGYFWVFNTSPGLGKCIAKLVATGAKLSGAAA